MGSDAFLAHDEGDVSSPGTVGDERDASSDHAAQHVLFGRFHGIWWRLGRSQLSLSGLFRLFWFVLFILLSQTNQRDPTNPTSHA